MNKERIAGRPAAKSRQEGNKQGFLIQQRTKRKGNKQKQLASGTQA